MEDIKVSVIMPSLNVVNYIEDCIESVINQDMKDIEIICVDAFSVDGTLEKLCDYQKADSRIVILKSDIKSYGYQVNLGITVAKGEYIAVIETDDLIKEGMLSKLYQKAKNNNLDYIKCEFAYLWKGTEGYVYEDCQDKDIEYNQVIDPSANPRIYINDCNIWRGLYKRDFLRRYNILLHESQGAAYQDIGFLMQVLSKAKTAMYINDTFYCYRIDREDASSYKNDILKYVYQEFKWLIEEKKIEKSKGLYLRLIQASLSECDKLLKKHEYTYNTNYMEAAYGWLKNAIDEAIVNRIVTVQDYDSCDWVLLKLFLEDFEIYAKIKKLKEEIEKEKENELRIFVGNSPIYIFGCGNYGKKILQIALRYNISVHGFIDNNSKLWGEKRYNLMVYSLNDFVNTENELKVVIANKKHWQDIRLQLKNKGINSVFIWK